jgi:hypothetical protein
VELEDEAELLQYREKVVAELERRAILLREIEGRVAEVEFSLKSASSGRRALLGGAGRIQVQEAHKAKLKDVMRELQQELETALIDLQRAETRLREVDIRLNDLHRHSEPEGEQ